MMSRIRRTPLKIAGKSGVSLIELIIVLLILAVAATHAVPYFADSLSRQRLQSAARRIKLDIQHTKQRAAHSSQSQQITFLPALNAYVIPGAPTLDRRPGIYRVQLGDPPYAVAIDKVEFASPGGVSLVFNGFGLAHGGGSIRLVSGPFRQTARIHDLSGAVELEAVVKSP